MDDLSLQQELNYQIRRQDECLEEIRKAIDELSRATGAYYRAKEECTLRMRADGMPATLINNCVKGDPSVMPEMMDYVKAQSMYDLAREGLNVAKKNVTVINDQIGREWGNRG